MARNMDNIVHEMMLKVCIYNKLLKVDKEALAATWHGHGVRCDARSSAQRMLDRIIVLLTKLKEYLIRRKRTGCKRSNTDMF